MKPKIVNADDHDVLNPMAGTSKYAAGTEDGIPEELEISDTKGDDGENDLDEDLEEDDDLLEAEPLPHEIVDPEEEDDEDEPA